MIADYYHSQFREDIQEFMGDTTVPYFGHSWSCDCRGLENVPVERRPEFLICLYFTVLVDQAMHAHYRAHYDRFQSLTRYPKFCHGLGQFQKNPRAILSVPVENGLVRHEEVEPLLCPGMELFVDEVADFFTNHMPEVTASGFFDKLVYDPDVQIPELFPLLDPKVRNRIDYQAYAALRAAVEKSLKPGENQNGH